MICVWNENLKFVCFNFVAIFKILEISSGEIAARTSNLDCLDDHAAPSLHKATKQPKRSTLSSQSSEQGSFLLQPSRGAVHLYLRAIKMEKFGDNR